MFPVETREKEYRIDGKYYSNINGNLERAEIYEDEVDFNSNWIETYVDVEKEEQLGNIFKVALCSKISVVNFDGIECYKIIYHHKEIGDIELWFEKSTGLVRKHVGLEYYYLFNVVDDDMIKLPEIPEDEKIISED